MRINNFLNKSELIIFVYNLVVYCKNNYQIYLILKMRKTRGESQVLVNCRTQLLRKAKKLNFVCT